jgi:HAD superfamily hydrolase (TIGR01509 family)
VDSEYLCHQGLSIALQAEGIRQSAQMLFQEFRGVELATILVSMEHRHGCSLPADFEPNYRAIVAELFERELRPIPGVQSVLEQLQVPFCVASNGPRAKMEHTLGLTGLRPYFGRHIYSAFDIGAWKPDPGLFLAAARGLGVTNSHCLVVEDSPVGLQAAHAARMPAVHYSPKPAEATHGTPQISHLSELLLLPGLAAR